MDKNDLIKIGFVDAAEWQDAGPGKLKHVGPPAWKSMTSTPRALYAFCEEDKVKYIGKTARSIAIRFRGYCDPGSTRATNWKCHTHIKKLLAAGRKVRILVLTDSSHLYWGPFKISLPGGLEDALVSKFCPQWNGTNKNPITESETLEELATNCVHTGIGSDGIIPQPIVYRSVQQTKWEILSKVGSKTIYFAPKRWRSWNKTAGGVLGTGRKLVFEYRTPKSPNPNNKITLRGQISDPTPKKSLASLVKAYKWTLPGAARPKTTVGYAIWGTNARSSRNKIPPYPSKGFTSNHDFLVWLDSWEHLVGVTPTGSLQNFITSV